MKVLFIQDSLGTGGAEKSNSELWYFLRENGVTIKVIVLEHRQKGIEKEILENGFDITFIDNQKLWQQVGSIAQLIKEFQPDIVHSVLFRASLRTRLAKLKTKFYHIESLVNCTYDPIRFADPKVNATALNLYKWLDKITTRKWTEEFIAITNEVREHYIQHLEIKPSKVSVIFRGRKANTFLQHKAQARKEITEELKFADTDIIVTHVGRQEYQKGHLSLLKAIKSIDEQLFADQVKFLFCGRDGNNTKEIETFLAKENLKTTILFLGHRHDVNKILAASDVFVFPSLYEGLGGSLIEAQAAALPIVCSDIKVFQEVVVSDKNALLFSLNDTAALAEKLLILTASKELRTQMGEESLKNFNQKFQLDNVNRQMLEHYKNIR
ncbi:glycosyltransferase family 4 protein [Flavobacterium phycosphaerae]|uniref:glycosyltransferase family 4 protein n=1 Tax=Flavobacterium phycosphaerae TaxID=2697515 RepID=UPI0013899784|nr:glycosyltransferase family 4 protein [Flavobacterium phycosphaerae]